MTVKENKILISYTIEDQGFQQAKLMYVAGKEDAGKGNLGTIVLPKPAEDVEIAPTLPDPVVFSYANTKGNNIRLREVLAKIDSDADPLRASTCTLTVLVPEVDDNWVSLTKDVTLVLTPPPDTKADPVPALRNPHGMAEAGEWLYFVDYESRHIAMVKKEILENVAQGDKLVVPIFDLSSAFAGDANAKGQAIIALGGKLYVLYISADAGATEHEPGHLIRLSIDGTTGALAVETKTRVGKNPQSIIPVMRKENGVDVVYLLIPAIGGEQGYEGTTNGTDSDIRVVPALGSWPDPEEGESAEVVVTGDAYPPPPPPNPPAAAGAEEPEPEDPEPNPTPTAYDIHAVGAAMRGGDSRLFILTQIYDSDAKKAYWRLYQISVSDFLDLRTKTGAPLTLTQATKLTSGDLEVQDGGVMVTPDLEFADDIYFWDFLYEQTLRKDDKEDRIWLVLGSPFLVTKAWKYGSPTMVDPEANPFAMFSCIGGVNVNSVDLTIETLHQAQREVSLKRGMRASKLSAGTTKGAISAASMSAEEGEEEDK
jgi:hypothetical protein